MTEIEELEKAARKAQEVAREANEAVRIARNKANEARRKPLRDIVARAHDLLCPYNHTDGCSWGYEGDFNRTGDWIGDAHDRWLSHYETLICGSDYTKPTITIEQLKELLDAIEKIKPRLKSGIWLLRSGKLVP